MKRHCAYNFKPINFTFTQTPESFIVEEQLTIKPKKRGKFLYLHLRKKELTTWQMIKIISEHFKIHYHTIGYAGLKDKHATTLQYLSLSNKAIDSVHSFSHPNIELLTHFLHDKPLLRGALNANYFTITLQNVELYTYNVIVKRLLQLQKQGIPNFFGYQRFGKGFDDLDAIKAVAHGDTYVKDKEKAKMITASYQSHLFNEWLNERIDNQLTNALHFHTPLLGDVARSGNRLYNVHQLPLQENSIITGLLPGQEVWRARLDAAKIESRFDDLYLPSKGERRNMLIFLERLSHQYEHEKKCVTLSFALPKGSYATVLLEQIKAAEL